MRSVLLSFLALVVIVVAAPFAVALLDEPAPPPPATTLLAPFAGVDFSGLPPLQKFTARDGQDLAYRVYPGGGDHVVIAIHGSSGSSSSLHPLAKAFAQAGATVVVPDIRGHGASGPRGDIAYIGQLEDDMQDLLAVVRKRYPHAELTLVGFSSGGGFALRVAASPLGANFSRTLLLAPFLRYDAANVRNNGESWSSVAVPRIVALSILSKFGITALNFLPVVKFGVQPADAKYVTAQYSYRLLTNFGPDDDYRGDLRRAHGTIVIVGGTDDEIFDNSKLAEATSGTNAALRIVLVPGVSHIGLTTTEQGTSAVIKAWNGLDDTRTGKIGT